MPFSPACGFRASTAIRGLMMPKSRASDSLKMPSFSTMASFVMACGTSAMGRWVVTSATRRSSLQRIISDLLPSPMRDSRYSVCPGKWNSSLCMVFLLIGAVTSTSMMPLRKSSAARFSEASAAFPAISVALPNSIFTSPSSTSTRLLAFSSASSARGTMLKFTLGSSNALRW